MEKETTIQQKILAYAEFPELLKMCHLAIIGGFIAPEIFTYPVVSLAHDFESPEMNIQILHMLRGAAVDFLARKEKSDCDKEILELLEESK